MKLTLSHLAPLVFTGALLAGPALAAADVAVSTKPSAQARSSEATATKARPAANTEAARKDAKAVKSDGAGKTPQLEVPVKVVLTAD